MLGTVAAARDATHPNPTQPARIVAVTPPYKIALGFASATLLVSAGVRLLGGDGAGPVDTAAVLAEAEAEPAGPGTNESPIASSAEPADDAERAPGEQAPSKAPPTLIDVDLETAAGVDSAMGSDAGAEASRPITDESPPTLTVGRSPDGDGSAPADATVVLAFDSERDSVDEDGDAIPTYTVQRGDTFEAIARRELGASSRWVALAKANPTVDPLKLRVGDVLRLPVDEPEPVVVSIDAGAADDAPGDARLPPPPDPVTYVVRSGDSLSTIAARFYADSSRWRAIFNANRDQLRDPHAVRIGMELRIPPAIAAAPESLEN